MTWRLVPGQHCVWSTAGTAALQQTPLLTDRLRVMSLVLDELSARGALPAGTLPYNKELKPILGQLTAQRHAMW